MSGEMYTPEQMSFDRPALERLKKEYAKAYDNCAPSFVFEGRELLTRYAKYLIEYLETKLP